MRTKPVVLGLAFLLTLSQMASTQEVPDIPAGSGKGREAIESLLQDAGLEASSKAETIAAASRSLLVRWDSGQAKPGPVVALAEKAAIPGGRFTLADQKPAAGEPQWQRFPELSPDQLVVAVVGAAQQLLTWNVITDPRLLRSELPDALGELRHQRFYYAKASFWADLPVAGDAAELHIYQPVWDGREFTLEPLAKIALEKGDR